MDGAAALPLVAEIANEEGPGFRVRRLPLLLLDGKRIDWVKFGMRAVFAIYAGESGNHGRCLIDKKRGVLSDLVSVRILCDYAFGIDVIGKSPPPGRFEVVNRLLVVEFQFNRA